MQSDKKLLTINETAHYLGYVPATIWAKIKTGELGKTEGLVVYKGRKCFDKEMLDASIEEARQNG